jgi:maltose O-acetyltransferase
MMAGDHFYNPDRQLMAMRAEGRARLQKLNETPMTDAPARFAAIDALFGRPTRCWIESPLFLEYGVHTEIGNFSFINANCTFLDTNRISIGSRVLIGTGVQLLTSGHPIEPYRRQVEYPEDERFSFRGVAYAHAITIGDDCWIGAGAIVLGGVTIGEGTTIGAGSVVTKAIPANVLAVGNPCRVVREIPPQDPAEAARPQRPHDRAGWPNFAIE